MTDERKNEIWAMLTWDEKQSIVNKFTPLKVEVNSLDDLRTGKYKFKDTFDNGYTKALIDLFGKCNIDNAILCPVDPTEETCKENAESFTDSTECVKESSNSFQSSTDWNNYRLVLAKDLAVKMITNSYRNGIISNDEILSHDIVRLVNEIIKRLKETEDV